MKSRIDRKKRYATALALPLAIACSGLAAESPPLVETTQMIEPAPRIQAPVPMARPPVCADPRVTLDYTTMENGIVRLTGTVANRGTVALTTPVEAQYVMDVRYPPKTYSQVGLSEQLCKESFQGLTTGQSVTVQCSYRIPDFAAWEPDSLLNPLVPPAQTRSARRLFTLRVVRADMAPFTRNQDCNAADTQSSVELSYRAVAP